VTVSGVCLAASTHSGCPHLQPSLLLLAGWRVPHNKAWLSALAAPVVHWRLAAAAVCVCLLQGVDHKFTKVLQRVDSLRGAGSDRVAALSAKVKDLAAAMAELQLERTGLKLKKCR
jgi:hypothetical protein